MRRQRCIEAIGARHGLVPAGRAEQLRVTASRRPAALHGLQRNAVGAESPKCTAKADSEPDLANVGARANETDWNTALEGKRGRVLVHSYPQLSRLRAASTRGFS